MKTRDPVARALRTPRYRPRVVISKKRQTPRKSKHVQSHDD